MSYNTHISPTQDTGGNVNYLPNSCNISDISMISVYWSDIMNKPGFCNVSITGSYNDLLNVPSLSTVAFSGDYNSLSNRPWINSDSNIYNNNQGNVGIGTNNPTEKLHLVGNFSISGDIIPAINSNFNLGSSNYKWKDLYLSGNSIYLDNLIISKNSSNNLEIRDSDNNLRSISLNQLELNDGDNKLRFLYSNGALVFNSNGINIQGIEFSNYSKIIYSNNLYTTSNTIIDYTNYRINNLNFNTGGGGNGATININTDTIQIGTSNKFITSNIYESDITFMNNLNVNGSYQLNNCNIPFSLMKFTNITTTNGVFTYNTSSNDFGYFSFVNSGTITFPQTTACDVLVVGAGGNGGTGNLSGGGGAGEVIAYPSYSFPSGTYTIQVGTSGTSSNNRISKISSNSIDLLLAKGGADGYGIQSNITSSITNYSISNNSYIDYNYSGLSNISSGTSNFLFTNDGNIITTSKNFYSGTPTPTYWYRFDDSTNIGLDSMGLQNFTDSSTPPSLTTNSIKGNTSLLLNGTNWLENTNIDFSAKDFSISFWAIMNSTTNLTGDRFTFFGNANNSSTTGSIVTLYYYYNASSPPQLVFDAYGTAVVVTVKELASELNRWNFYTFTFLLSSKTVSIYRNGVLLKSASNGSINISSSFKTHRIGGLRYGSTNYGFNGAIDDFRIYLNTVLSAAQILQLFDSSVDRNYPILRNTNNQNINPDAWYRFDTSGNLGLDSSGNSYNLTNGSSVVTYNSTRRIKGTGAAEFNGAANSYLTGLNINLDNKDFSIAMWVNLTNYNASSYMILFANSVNAGTRAALHIGYNQNASVFFDFMSDAITYSQTNANDVGVWVHWCFTYANIGRIRRIYKNGILVQTGAASANLSGSTGTYTIGYRFSSDVTGFILNGLMDDFRIYNNLELSAAQIQELYQGRVRVFNGLNIESGSGGGGYGDFSITSSIGSKWDSNYSYISNGYTGTSNQGGNGGGALSNIGLTTSLVTGSSLTIGEGGSGATLTSTPISKITYGSGGDGNGGSGTNGIVIVKVPLNTCNVKFDGFIYSSNIFDLNYNTITLMSFASNQLNASIVNTSNKLIDYDNLVDKPWINSNLIIYNNNQGNVGIGTNNPLSKLDVNGDINFSGTLRLNQRSLPFSVYSNTNILSSNGLFNYIPNNFFFGYYTFLTNGTITFPQTTSCDIIVVGAGGNGGINNLSGGGGAGEVIAFSSYSFTSGSYNIQIGTTNDISSSNLRSTIISSNNTTLITAKGGGDGAYTGSFTVSGAGTYITSNASDSTLNTYVSFRSGTNTLNIPGDTIVDVLIVGGGGGGGSRHGGGGGAGAVIYLTNQTLSAGTYTVTVGAGGASTSTQGQGGRGGDTSVVLNGTNVYLAKGGGGGYHAVSSGNSNKDGGSGGGGGDISGLAVTTNVPANKYGNDGGIYMYSANTAGGGGGGAGANGTNGLLVSGTTNLYQGGTGGIGRQIAITGTSVYYGGGGGGGSDPSYPGGTGGLGGGGAGSSGTATATSGTANTGGGGGGGGYSPSGNGTSGAGGSGIIIIRFKTNAYPTIGGSGGGGVSSAFSNNYSNAALAGTKWNITSSFVTNGSNGTLTQGGNGGSALSNIGYTETITSNSFVLGVGGLGATSNSVPSLKTTYGSGGDGNGGLGTQGIVIIKVPLNIQRPRFDGYINYSNIDNRPVLNELLSTNNYLNIGYYNQVNFPLGDVSWNNEWFLYIGRSPTSVQNSFIFWHLTSNINSKWWFNGTQTSTNNEISDERIKKEITEIQNPLDKLMLIKPKEYYLCDEKDYLRKYGVIAQDVASNQELSHLVYKDDDFIANVYTNATYVSSPKFLLTTTTSIIGKVAVDDELKLLLDNMNIDNIEIIIEETPYHNRYKKRYVKVKEIIDEFTIEIYEEIELSENEKSNILIYGKKVNDFNKLDYSSLYSLNIACTQELYKIIQEQKNKIDDLEQRIIQLENR